MVPATVPNNGRRGPRAEHYTGAACATLDPCDCAGNVVIADDGRRSTALNQSDVTVSCLAGLCQSSVQ